MADFAWLVRRLKAMGVPEVAWRVSQKALQKSEEKKFKVRKSAVTDTLFNVKLIALQLDADRMHLNWDNQHYSLNTVIPLLGGYDYETYKKQWNAGFQTEHKWPEQFSYALEYKQRDDIGDARTNWELNRHFQFALLAKDYAASGGRKYLGEFRDLFHDWNEKNPFLHGISWTSVMEVAIRCSNWCYSYCFLASRGETPQELLEELQTGILNMTDYIVNHYSRYSSANNHLIVEAYAIGQTGVLCNYSPWIKLAVDILARELPRQNYSDGINKELSLHYQSFYMEAMGLMMRLLVKNSMVVPESWKSMLQKMCHYVAGCIGKYGEVVVFGDDDEGKILDLQGGEIDHYKYVLQLLGILLGEKYKDGEIDENNHWLFDENEIRAYEKKQLYKPDQYVIYKDGGNSILRSQDNEVLIGVDHAALGFGSIAAHGHADALSFQLFYGGKPVFVDPGTYIYHCDLQSRNEFRKTRNHNTVCVEDKDQSEMLGAFLWGRKANAKLISSEEKDGEIKLTMEHDGYAPVKHRRSISFDGERKLKIKDSVSSSANATACFVFAPDIRAVMKKDGVDLYRNNVCCASMNCRSDGFKATKHGYSNHYGIKQVTTGVSIVFDNECIVEVVFM